MTIDFRNTNTVWASVVVETLVRLGLARAVICPGSRSGPLATAFAQHPQVEAIPVLDERSAAFFALGLGQWSRKAAAVVCTSGTAGANFFPAVIEARESQVPLLLLTADRPPELRHCHAGQAIDQAQLFGNYPNWQVELAVPSLELSQLAYLRQTLVQAWERTLMPVRGPVHLNCPLREPLFPRAEVQAQAFAEGFPNHSFFEHLVPSRVNPSSIEDLGVLLDCFQGWQTCRAGIIVVGCAQPECPPTFCEDVAWLSQALNWPVLADVLSPLRNYHYLNPRLVSTYDLIVRQHYWAELLVPQQVIQVGELPTSKELRLWFQGTQPQRWVIDPGDQNLDPLHGPTRFLRLHLGQLVKALRLQKPVASLPSAYLQQWQTAETQARQFLDTELAAISDLQAPKLAWLMPQVLPEGTPIFIANSMPVRDLEWFWPLGDRRLRPFFNRGANGIDGILSTALGIAHDAHQASILVTGDLALLHDANGFLLRHQFQGHLTIVVINNNGGGIFEMLPIAEFDPPFEAFFATPQGVGFTQLCAAYQVPYHRIQDWRDLQQQLTDLSSVGIRVLEIPTDRKREAQWRQGCFAENW